MTSLVSVTHNGTTWCILMCKTDADPEQSAEGRLKFALGVQSKLPPVCGEVCCHPIDAEKDFMHVYTRANRALEGWRCQSEDRAYLP